MSLRWLNLKKQKRCDVGNENEMEDGFNVILTAEENVARRLFSSYFPKNWNQSNAMPISSDYCASSVVWNYLEKGYDIFKKEKKDHTVCNHDHNGGKLEYIRAVIIIIFFFSLPLFTAALSFQLVTSGRRQKENGLKKKWLQNCFSFLPGGRKTSELFPRMQIVRRWRAAFYFPDGDRRI